MVEQLVKTAFGGSAEGLFMALLNGRGISQEESARLRVLIDQAESRAKSQGQREGRSRS